MGLKIIGSKIKVHELLTGLSVAFGIGAFSAFLFAFLAARLGKIILGAGLLEWGIFSILFFLAAIWFKIGAIYHKK